jgi:hypothetical protein
MIQQAKESFRLILIPDLPETPRLIAASREEYNTKIIDYNMIKVVYDKVVPG